MIFNPNTRILCGKLKESDLEKLIELYKEIGLNVNSPFPAVDSINSDNKKWKEFEITPDATHSDYKLIIGIKNFKGDLYIDAYVNANLELKEKYDRLVREYFLNH